MNNTRTGLSISLIIPPFFGLVEIGLSHLYSTEHTSERDLTLLSNDAGHVFDRIRYRIGDQAVWRNVKIRVFANRQAPIAHMVDGQFERHVRRAVSGNYAF